jgi:uncharacterized sulfatase
VCSAEGNNDIRNSTMKRFCIFSITLFLFGIAVSYATAESRPNVLFIAIDDLRPEIGAYAVNRAVTPNIDAFAKTGVRFDRAYVTYPLCLPSRASMLTGKRLDHKGADKGVGFSELIQRGHTWPRKFREAGYWTAVSGKLYHGSVPKVDTDAWDVPGEFWKNGFHDWSPALMTKVVREGGDADALATFKTSGKGGSGALIWQAIDGDDNILTDGQTASEVIGFLRSRPKDKPFVICAGFSRPHMPWLAPKQYFDLYRDVDIELAPLPEDAKREVLPEDAGSGVSKKNALWNEGVSDEQARDLIRGYLASASYSDAQAGRILKVLRDEGLQDNTIVIIWGDHGYHLTDHGLWRKNTIYHIANRIPLLIRAPGFSQDAVAKGLVESIDIYPTLMELAGLQADDLLLDGTSLVPLLRNPDAVWDAPAYITGGTYHGIVTDRYRFSVSSKHPAKLFDLRHDIHEWDNLADDPKHADIASELTQKVEEMWGETR